MTTEQIEMADRIRSYIQHNATKSPQAMTELVQRGHDQLFALTDGLSEQQATFKPSADDWSVLETMRHVVAGKRGAARVCTRLAGGDAPSNVGGEGQVSTQDGIVGEEFTTLADARAAAQAAHDELVEFIGALSPGTNVEARYRHFVFGDLNCREWAAFQRVHDGDHANQIEKIQAVAGFPKA
ncbi:MAG: DinB family protein [Dehalococcoidia bacterium]